MQMVHDVKRESALESSMLKNITSVLCTLAFFPLDYVIYNNAWKNKNVVQFVKIFAIFISHFNKQLQKDNRFLLCFLFPNTYTGNS